MRGEDPIRVLIVDSHELFAQGLSSILRHNGLEVVGVATTEDQAMAMVGEKRPQSLVIDIAMPGGLSLGQRIMKADPDVRVVALTEVHEPRTIREALAGGFQGYVLKADSPDQLVGAIVGTVRSQVVFPYHYIDSVIRPLRDMPDDTGSLIGTLTDREREVLRLLARGASGRLMAAQLSLSPNTIRTHVQNILTKLQVHSRLQAVAYATRHGFLNGHERSSAAPTSMERYDDAETGQEG